MQYKGLVVLCVLLFIAVPLGAQEDRCGVGINLVDIFQLSGMYELPLTIYQEQYGFPVFYGIMQRSSIRYEAELSYWRYDRSSSSSLIHLGLGIMPFIRGSVKKKTYAGVRLGLNYNLTDESMIFVNDQIEYVETTRTDFYLGSCLGTERYITDNLSLGGEAQLLYFNLGDTKIDSDKVESAGTSDSDSHVIKTNVLVFLRWYF